MKVLFIGGTGTISSACSELALQRGIELYLLVRGQSARPVPQGARILQADIRDPESARQALGQHKFDAVVDWVAFKPEQVETDIALFSDRTDQYVFISSASAYRKPAAFLPITESAQLHNPDWQYSADKIACEDRLVQAFRSDGFPMTIVRPAHTYDRRSMPLPGRYTQLHRLRRGKKAIIHGDGNTLWTLTHHRDFAVGFVGLLGNPRAVGEAFHITSDEWLTWNQIFQIVARAARVELRAVHIPSDFIAAYDPDWGPSLVGDKAHNLVLDNSKIKRLVPEFRAGIPFSRGAEEIMTWYDADPARQVLDEKLDANMDRMLAAFESALPR